MAKSKGRRRSGGGASKRKGGGCDGGGGGWSYDYQESRRLKKQKTLIKKCLKRKEEVKEEKDEEDEKLQLLQEKLASREKRQNKLSHDSVVNQDEKKLMLHLQHVKRQLKDLRHNLQHWDQEEETMKQLKLEEERKKKAEEEARGPLSLKELADLKRFKRYHPSNWKIRGAARPAWEVYDFDTRYECPHLKAFEDAKSKAKRIENIFVKHRGEFLSTICPQPQCRTFVTLLYQYGMLNIEAKRYKSSIKAFEECVEMEGKELDQKKKDDKDEVALLDYTPARSRLMRLYLEQNLPDKARNFYETFNLSLNKTAWTQYSQLLVEYVSWKLLKEMGSSEARTLQQFHRSVTKGNVFCAYRIAYHDVFAEFVEYAEDIEDAQGGSLLEAIEYGASEQLQLWHETEGAIEWLKSVLEHIQSHGQISYSLFNEEEDNNDATKASSKIETRDIDWKESLATSEEDDADLMSESFALSKYSNDKSIRDEDNVVDDEEEEKSIDVSMYRNMFQAAMESL